MLIHGNSACKEIFARQFNSELTKRHRLIAFDLPGHGASSDAFDPARTYHMPGYADVALEVLQHLGITRPVVLGWSLGGHIGIELLTRPIEIAGLVITGTPPVGHNPADFAAGFLPHEHMALTGKDAFSEADIRSYAQETTGDSPAFIEAAVRRTDGRARRLMMETASAGRGADQRDVVTGTRVPTAVINGMAEPFVNNHYVAGFPYGNLWDGRVHLLDGAGHAPFWEQPAAFNALLARFLSDTSN